MSYIVSDCTVCMAKLPQREMHLLILANYGEKLLLLLFFNDQTTMQPLNKSEHVQITGRFLRLIHLRYLAMNEEDFTLVLQLFFFYYRILITRTYRAILELHRSHDSERPVLLPHINLHLSRFFPRESSHRIATRICIHLCEKVENLALFLALKIYPHISGFNFQFLMHIFKKSF